MKEKRKKAAQAAATTTPPTDTENIDALLGNVVTSMTRQATQITKGLFSGGCVCVSVCVCVCVCIRRKTRRRAFD
jgi:hypothetical protein